MTPRRTPAGRGVGRPAGLVAAIGAAIVLWLALSPLLAGPSLTHAPGSVPPTDLAAASASAAPSAGSPTTGAAPTGTPRTSGSGGTAAAATPRTTRTTAKPQGSAATSPASPSATASPGGLPLLAHGARGASATPLMKAALDRELGRLRAKLGIPGASAAILFPDGTMWTGTSGFADVAARRRVTPETPFAVGSISKTFTAALVVSLAAEGRIDLDAPVRTYLPTLKVDPRITVRELLDHTSGLNDFFFHPKIDAALLADPARTWLPADSLRYVGKPYFQPGRGYHYSNTNYLVLGMLAETVGGAPIADQLQARFIGPLGLTGTIYQGAEQPTVAPAHAYRFAGTGVKLPPIDVTGDSSIVPFTSVVTAAGGAGSIATTAVDLVHWARALYGGDALAEPALRAMIGDIPRTSIYGRGVAYGLGVQSVVLDGWPTLGHSGRLLGSQAVMRWLPTASMSIAVLTNQSRADPQTIARQLLKIAVVPPADCTACPDGW